VADSVAVDLAAAVAAPARIRDARRALRGMATRYRAFAHRAPGGYQLLFGVAGTAATAPSPAANTLAAAGLLRVTDALAGPDDSLQAARLLVAFAHGFVSMELAGAFRLGGNVDAAFGYGVEAIVRGVTTPPT